MYYILKEHLAECERFKYFQSAKWSKVKIKSVPSSFFGLPFLYLPNVLIHEPNEFIHVRVVNELSKFKFTVQRLSDLVLTYSVGKGDFWIVLPSSWILLSVALWCLHLEHCCSSTPAVQLCPLNSVQSVYSPWGRVFPKEPCRDLTWLYPTEHQLSGLDSLH